MLFDIRGRRRRLFKAIYIVLSLLIGIGLIGYGIGSNADFSVFDIFGQGGGGGGQNVLEKQIKKYEKKTRKDPEDEQNWLKLVRANYQYAIQLLNASQSQGQQTIEVSEDTIVALKGSTKAWKRYASLKPKKVDVNAAGMAAKAFANLGKFNDAIKVQQIVVDEKPGSGTFSYLAEYAYQANNMRVGDLAAKKALELTPKKGRKEAKQYLDQIKKQAEQQAAQEALEKSKAQSGKPTQ